MAMKVVSSEFIKSAVKPAGYPETGFQEVAFAGKSNVGKSSLINKLLNRKSLAKTSSTPGKTRLINFFLINKDLVFVDLPGYGYAKVSKSERGSWRPMVEAYFSNREALKGVVLLQDIRREPNEKDRQMADFIRHYKIPLILVLTKADKLSRNKQQKRIKALSGALPPADTGPILFSSHTGLGKDELWDAITKAAKEAF